MIRTMATIGCIAGIMGTSWVIYDLAKDSTAVANAAIVGERSTATEPLPTTAGPVAVPSTTLAPVQNARPADSDAGRPAAEPVARTEQQRDAALQVAVTTALQDFPGTYSVGVYDLTTKHLWTVNDQAPYHPASTIKLPVALYAVHQYQAGKLKWSDLITYTQGDFETPGGGALETAPFGSQYTVENLVNRSLMYSNNIAVNMLGRTLGWENVRTWSRSIEGDLSRLPDGTPQVTVLSEVGWWRHVDQLAHDDPKAADLILGPLHEVAYHERILAGLPAGVPAVHKFGSYHPYFHDGALIGGDHPYILVVMTNGGSVDKADEAIAAVARAVHPLIVGAVRP